MLVLLIDPRASEALAARKGPQLPTGSPVPIQAPKGDLSAPRGCPPKASDTRVSRGKLTCVNHKCYDSCKRIPTVLNSVNIIVMVVNFEMRACLTDINLKFKRFSF
jgi:hypothetical protein